jgi:hypothetical protein
VKGKVKEKRDAEINTGGTIPSSWCVFDFTQAAGAAGRMTSS